ncbi:MAG: metallophosphoesterase family protein [Deltaproteobacteria bacterium]|nr:metallophosphoesterase family protein [Deltaproteobacteria bacterium]
MRIGIFSDVHANIEALTEVLRALRARDVEQFVCLGDVIGYGADPEPCIRAIREVTTHTILGNHDAAGCGRMNLNEYYAEAREAIVYSWGRLGEEDRSWIRSLPYSVRQDDILFCHGAPHAPEHFEYLFSEEQAEDYRQDFATLPGVTFIGHSHLTVGFALTPKHVAGFVEPEVRLQKGSKYIFTVGSVGQPRDRDTRAACVVFDTTDQRVEYVRVPYDISATQRKILAAGLPPQFAQRLQLGM